MPTSHTSPPVRPPTPMLAVNGALPSGPSWSYELKWDGVRALAVVDSGRVHLYARSGAEITVAYPELAGLSQQVGRAVLDGEIVVLDAAGAPSFAALAERMHVRGAARAEQLAASVPATYMIFDLLELEGEDLTGRPYEQRREALEGLAPAGRRWLVPPRFSDGEATLAAATEHSLEGVVAKRSDSLYRPGLRSPDWVKVKLEQTGDFVVGGWRPGERQLGALLVGVPAPGGGLEFRGRVGGGISAAAERSLLAALAPLAAPDSPFAAPLDRENSRDAHWVRPELVVELRYGQRTAEGRLRFPRFLRQRPDKSPADCMADDASAAGQPDLTDESSELRQAPSPERGAPEEPPDASDRGPEGPPTPVREASGTPPEGPPAPPEGPPAPPEEATGTPPIASGGADSGGAAPGGTVVVRVGARDLELSNLDKVLYPATGFTKAEVIDYYSRIAEVMLPHLRGRALTRIRFPNGVDAASFFEKNAPAGTPRWVRRETLPVPGSTTGRETLDYIVADDLPTLVWLANLAALELHTPQWRVATVTPPDATGEWGPGMPDLLVLDLDPGAPAGLSDCFRVALALRERLTADGLRPLPKTSGKKGMQLYCPIAATQPADAVSAYARRIAGELRRADPKRVTDQMAKRLRPGKVFIDWSQNNAAKTTVAAYSMRAEPTPSVSTPLTWEEVEAGQARQFTPTEVLDRVDRHGDLLADLLAGGPELPAEEVG